MKVRIRIKISQGLIKSLEATRIWMEEFRITYPFRSLVSLVLLSVVVLTPLLKFLVLDKIFSNKFNVSANTYSSKMKSESIEKELNQEISKVLGATSTKVLRSEVLTDVGFVDLRVLTLEDLFRYYKSPLLDYSDEFIEACERYNVNNWQLLPAIAMAETLGCQTGESFRQRNCWGWGGSGTNRVEFDSFKEAIDTITYRMINGYGNERMNAKDIQSTYCGASCMEWGWRWARSVNNYTVIINDFGEKYGLGRTNEIKNF